MRPADTLISLSQKLPNGTTNRHRAVAVESLKGHINSQAKERPPDYVIRTRATCSKKEDVDIGAMYNAGRSLTFGDWLRKNEAGRYVTLAHRATRPDALRILPAGKERPAAGVRLTISLSIKSNRIWRRPDETVALLMRVRLPRKEIAFRTSCSVFQRQRPARRAIAVGYPRRTRNDIPR